MRESIVAAAYRVGRKMAQHDRLVIGSMVALSIVVASIVAGLLVSNAIRSYPSCHTKEGWSCKINSDTRIAICRLP